jgi:hypothetical protein
MNVLSERPDLGPSKSTDPAAAAMLVHVVANDPLTLQDALTDADLTLRENLPPENPQGILLTRHSKCLFTIARSPDVPHGITMEQDRWHRH